MAYSYVDYVADGATTFFTFNKGYIDAAHVHVSVNGVAQVQGVNWSFADPQTVKLNVAPVYNSVVHIWRSSSPDQRLVDFVNGSTFDESELDTAFLQSFYISLEAYDGLTQSIIASPTTLQWEGLNKRLTNMGAPTSANDAATKAYVDAHAGGASGNVPTPDNPGMNGYVLVANSGTWAWDDTIGSLTCYNLTTTGAAAFAGQINTGGEIITTIVGQAGIIYFQKNIALSNASPQYRLSHDADAKLLRLVSTNGAAYLQHLAFSRDSAGNIGPITTSAAINPNTTNLQDLGASGARWGTLYAARHNVPRVWCSLARAADSGTIVSGASYTISWDTLDADSDNMFTGGSPTLITARTAGAFQFNLHIDTTSSGSVAFVVAIKVNGTTKRSGNYVFYPAYGVLSAIDMPVVLDLAVNDNVTVVVTPSSGPYNCSLPSARISAIRIDA